MTVSGRGSPSSSASETSTRSKGPEATISARTRRIGLEDSVCSPRLKELLSTPTMEIRTEIEISATPAEVWAELVEFPRYPEWNPFIVSLRGETKVGTSLEVTMSLPDSNKEHTFRPRLVKCEEAAELRWLGHLWMKGLFDGEHFFRLESSG